MEKKFEYLKMADISRIFTILPINKIASNRKISPIDHSHSLNTHTNPR